MIWRTAFRTGSSVVSDSVADVTRWSLLAFLNLLSGQALAL